jgi:hypothetical protein
MQDLRVIGVENGALLVASDDGTRFRIPIDELLQSRLRQALPEPSNGKKIAPKDIQSHIRAGMSADEVAELTGVSLEYIQRFEGPVLAEREYVVNTALGVPVHTALETDPLAQGATFGSVIGDRLYALGATDEVWASWKEPGVGWIVKLTFTANSIDHDARWQFEPKKLALDPQNSEATTLSQQGDGVGALIPRLRAVGFDERQPDATRFDSGAFDLLEAAAPDARTQQEPAGRSTQPLPDLPAEMNQTADLLEALRRRRGERESATFDPETVAGPSTPSPMHPSTGGIRLVDIPLDFGSAATPPEETPSNGATGAAQQSQTGPQVGLGKNRKGRQAMPSWDEIVFGARPDDDLA